MFLYEVTHISARDDVDECLWSTTTSSYVMTPRITVASRHVIHVVYWQWLHSFNVFHRHLRPKYFAVPIFLNLIDSKLEVKGKTQGSSCQYLWKYSGWIMEKGGRGISNINSWKSWQDIHLIYRINMQCNHKNAG